MLEDVPVDIRKCFSRCWKMYAINLMETFNYKKIIRYRNYTNEYASYFFIFINESFSFLLRRFDNSNTARIIVRIDNPKT